MCPEEETIHLAGIGQTIILTGMAASLSGGYALYSVFSPPHVRPSEHHEWWAIPFGLFWGLLIFNLDRNLVMRTSAKNRSGVAAVSIRIALAIVLAIVISRPLELRLFQPEIDARILMKKSAELDTNKRSYDSAMSAAETAYNTAVQHAAEQKVEDVAINAKDEGAYSECRRNKSDSFAKYNAAWNECHRDAGTPEQAERCRHLRAPQIICTPPGMTSAAVITRYDNAISSADNSRRTAENAAKAAWEKADTQTDMHYVNGFLARNTTLSEMEDDKTTGSSVWWTVVLLCAAFVLIELTPVVSKLWSPPGAYEQFVSSRLTEAVDQSKTLASEAARQVQASAMNTIMAWQPGDNARVIEERVKQLYLATLPEPASSSDSPAADRSHQRAAPPAAVRVEPRPHSGWKASKPGLRQRLGRLRERYPKALPFVLRFVVVTSALFVGIMVLSTFPSFTENIEEIKAVAEIIGMLGFFDLILKQHPDESVESELA
jgi:hypothetical protein